MDKDEKDWIVSKVFAAVAAAICWIWPLAIPVIIFIIFLFIFDLRKRIDKTTEWAERRIYNLSAETWVLYGRTEPIDDDPYYDYEPGEIRRMRDRTKWEYVDHDYFLEEIYGTKPKKRDIPENSPGEEPDNQP